MLDQSDFVVFFICGVPYARETLLSEAYVQMYTAPAHTLCLRYWGRKEKVV